MRRAVVPRKCQRKGTLMDNSYVGHCPANSFGFPLRDHNAHPEPRGASRVARDPDAYRVSRKAPLGGDAYGPRVISESTSRSKCRFLPSKSLLRRSIRT